MNKKILNLAIPNIISNLSIPLLGIVDLAVLGHLDSEKYIGAIALGTMIFNFIYWGFSFLRMGTSGFTSQALGARDLKESVQILGRSLSVAAIGSFLLLALQIPIEIFCFKIVQASSEVELLASQYFYIRIWAAPATISLYALGGWFIGMQDSKSPMWITIIINILNIGFNLLFVYHFNMNSNGVALGTVIAQYIGALLAFAIYFKFYGKLTKYLNLKEALKFKHLKRFFQVNIDIFIRTFCLIFTFSFFTTVSAGTNDTILAINTLLFQFLMVFSYLLDGFAYSAEALTGKYIGSKNTSALKKMIKYQFIWGLTISVFITIIYVIFSEKMLYIFTDQIGIIEGSKPYIFWIYFIPLISFPAFLFDGIYIGATSSKTMRNAMLFSTFIIFFPLYYFTKDSLGNNGLWLALIVFMAARSISLWLPLKKKIINKT